MSQQEILNFLKQNKNKWFSVKEIAEKTNLPKPRITHNLMRLRKSEYIFYKFNKNLYQNGTSYIYKYKNF